MPTYRVTLTETIVYTVDVDAPSADAAAEIALEGMQEVEGYNAFDADSAGDLRVVEVEAAGGSRERMVR